QRLRVIAEGKRIVQREVGGFVQDVESVQHRTVNIAFVGREQSSAFRGDRAVLIGEHRGQDQATKRSNGRAEAVNVGIVFAGQHLSAGRVNRYWIHIIAGTVFLLVLGRDDLIREGGFQP